MVCMPSACLFGSIYKSKATVIKRYAHNKVLPVFSKITVFQAVLIYYYAVYVYPVPIVGYDQRAAESVGWLVTVVPMSICIVLGAVHAVVKQKGSLKQVFNFLFF